jgi:B9 domain-containing protein 1
MVKMYKKQFKGENYIKLSFEVHTGTNEWIKVSGVSSGTTQSACFSKETDGKLTWGVPFDATYQATNPYGWPQIVLTAHGHDSRGNPIHLGYGSAHLPTTHGTEEIKIHLYTHQPFSGVFGFLHSIFGTKTDVAKPVEMMVKNEGREATRVKNIGYVRLKLQTTLRNMSKHGYQLS